MSENRFWLKDWRGRIFIWALAVILGFAAATAVTAVAKGAPDQAMQCPSDMPGCAKTPAQHRDQFRAGYYRAVPRSINYRRGFRRHVLHVAARKWNRTHAVSFHPRRQWRNFTHHDTCVANHYPANTVDGCWRYRTITRADRRAQLKVLFCGATMAIAVASRNGWVAVVGGGLLCGWQFADHNLQ